MRRALLPIVVVTLCVSSASSRPRELTLQERIEAQRSIDRVYYQHQEGATQPFESAVPTSVLEKKVHTYLKQSAALEKFWQSPVDAQALRDEWERIARESRLPDRLREIYAALGNDPFLIQECFVRPVLVDRLTRKFLAFDPRVQGPPRENAERLRRQLASGTLDPWKDQPGRRAIEIVVTRQEERDLNAGSEPVHATRVELSEEEFRRTRDSLPGRIGEIGPLQESPEAFTFSAPLEGSAEHLLLASYRVEKVDWEAWSRQVGRDIDESEVRPVAQGASISVAPGNHSQSVSDSSPVPTSLDSATGNTGSTPLRRRSVTGLTMTATPPSTKASIRMGTDTRRARATATTPTLRCIPGPWKSVTGSMTTAMVTMTMQIWTETALQDARRTAMTSIRPSGRLPWRSPTSPWFTVPPR